MSTKIYRVKISKADQEFEVEGDKAFVLEMLKRFDNPSLPTLQTPKALKKDPISSSTRLKGLSVGEFIRQAEVKKHTDIVLAFGFYLEKHSGMKKFTPADINTCYYDAKMESSNTSQMIIQNIRRTFMMEAKGQKGDKKCYTLTQKGMDFIQGKLAKQM